MSDPEILANIALLLEGFDRGIFVRDTSQDHDPKWCLKSLPYLRALAKLKLAVEKVEQA